MHCSCATRSAIDTAEIRRAVSQGQNEEGIFEEIKRGLITPMRNHHNRSDE